MMTTRSRATWDEVKTNPFLQQVRPARWPAAFWFHALYGGRGCATTAARGGGANGRGRSRRPGETSMLVLRAAATSPFVRKVRIVASVLRLDGRWREGDPIRTASALPNIDPAGDGGWNRGGGRADPLRAPVA